MWLAIALAVIWGSIFVVGSYRCSVRHRRRRGGTPPWSHQYDARGLGQHIAEAHAASRAAAIHRHRRYHVRGLDHGEIAERECGRWSFSTRSIRAPAETAQLGLAPESSEIDRRSAKAIRDVRRQSYLTRSDQMP